MTKKELLESEDLQDLLLEFIKFHGEKVKTNWHYDIAEEFIEKELKKLNPTLFTTEDGVEIKKGDSYVTVRDFTVSVGFIARGDQNSVPGLKFSDFETATDWVFINKPSISLRMLLDLDVNRYDYNKVKLSLSK